jgi:hypothetical protein
MVVEGKGSKKKLIGTFLWVWGPRSWPRSKRGWNLSSHTIPPNSRRGHLMCNAFSSSFRQVQSAQNLQLC